MKKWMCESLTLCILDVMQQLVIKYGLWPCVYVAEGDCPEGGQRLERPEPWKKPQC